MAWVNRDLVIACLRELADEEFQRVVWTGEDRTRVSSFVECVEGLFEDSGLDWALADGPVFGDDIDDRLKELDALLAPIRGDEPIHRLLASPALVAARALAAEISLALEAQGPT